MQIVHSDNLAVIRLYGRFRLEIAGTQCLFGYGNARWTDAHALARLRKNQVLA